MISIFLIEIPIFNGFLKIIGLQNYLPITLCLDILNLHQIQCKNYLHLSLLVNHYIIIEIVEIIRLLHNYNFDTDKSL